MRGQKILSEVKYLLDDPTYSRYVEINQAYRKVCKLTKFNWLRETSETLLSFMASTSTYSLDMNRMRVLSGLYVKGGNDSRWKLLEEATPLLFEYKVREYQDRNGTDSTSKPLYYMMQGGQTTKISVTPTPDQAYSVRVNYIISTPEIEADTIVNLPENYFDTVATLAAGYILERNSNPERKQYGMTLIGRAMSEFEDLVRDSHPNHTLNIDRKEQEWMC